VSRSIFSSSFLWMEAMMCRHKERRGLTMVEVLILIGILGCVVIMLLPVILAAREKARK